jgi:hypothetical protein
MWVLLLSRLKIAQSQAQVGVGRGGATVRARVGGEARMHAVFVCAQSPLQDSRGGGLAIRLVWWAETDRRALTERVAAR